MFSSGKAGASAQAPLAMSMTQTLLVESSGVRPPVTYSLSWYTAAPIARVLNGTGVLFHSQLGALRSQLTSVSAQVESKEPPASAQPPITYSVWPLTTAWCDERGPGSGVIGVQVLLSGSKRATSFTDCRFSGSPAAFCARMPPTR